ncbi:hypothetical protein EJB05_31983 [Eragrostis curvula]|uniref:Uncharacterized protein n=1 Tax=Eragrostis curvula TaxID=38414 RepID=A0A5J9UGJ6_9POAL|nr:hypothetical protein EJB05_31983 [Eragrostis curvula]
MRYRRARRVMPTVYRSHRRSRSSLLSSDQALYSFTMSVPSAVQRSLGSGSGSVICWIEMRPLGSRCLLIYVVALVLILVRILLVRHQTMTLEKCVLRCPYCSTRELSSLIVN